MQVLRKVLSRMGEKEKMKISKQAIGEFVKRFDKKIEIAMIKSIGKKAYEKLKQECDARYGLTKEEKERLEYRHLGGR